MRRSPLTEWIRKAQAGDVTEIPDALDFVEMRPKLLSSRVTLSVWWCGGAAESTLRITFPEWVDILNGCRFFRSQKRFFEIPYVECWTFNTGLNEFELGNDDGGTYDEGSLEDLTVIGAKINGLDLARFLLDVRQSLKARQQCQG